MSDTRENRTAEMETEGARPPWWTLSGIAARTLKTRERFRTVMDVVGELRAPFIVSIFGVLAFASPGQTYEIYRLLAEEFEFENGFVADNLRFAIFFALLWVACYAIWYVGRALTLFDLNTTEALKRRGAVGAVARWAPRWIGAAPAFAAALGLAMAEITRSGDVRTPELYGAAGLAFLIGFLRVWSSYLRTKDGGGRTFERVHDTWFSLPVRLAFGAVLVAMTGYMMTTPIPVLQTLGPLSIICLFMIALLYFLAQLTYFSDRTGIPALGLVIGAALLFSWLDWNDNHYVRQVTPPDPFADAGSDGGAVMTAAEAEAAVKLTEARSSIDSAFDAWLAGRPNLDGYIEAGKQYPVYIIAAQGGGLYAAHQSATFLARLQDACPGFADHIFAISGVSGGAVGSTVFTSLMAAKDAGALSAETAAPKSRSEPAAAPSEEELFDCARAATDVPIEPKVRALFERDFLTPVLSSLLFGDFGARFSPRPIPQLSRAISLEKGFEAAWDEIAPGAAGQLSKGILDYWDPNGSAPILLINTTEVDSGLRMVLSPIRDLGPDLRTYAQVAAPDDYGRTPDLRLSTAMLLSARFPYITPAGSLDVVQPLPDGGVEVRKARLVDGGYFENSGIDTATDVLQALRARLRERRRALSRARRSGETVSRDAALDADIRLVVFDLFSTNSDRPSYALSELISPIQTILNARTKRSALAQLRARRSLFADCRYLLAPGDGGIGDDREQCLRDDLSKSKIWSVSLDGDAYDFALGWILSRTTLRQIERQLGAPEACKLDGENDLKASGEALDRRFGKKSKRAEKAAQLQEERAGQVEDAEEDPIDSIAVHNSCIAQFIVRQISGEGSNLRRSRTRPARTQ